MKPVLEDMFLGPETTPSMSQAMRFRWEDSLRRVRVIFAGVTIADSTKVMRLIEYGRLPVYYFPQEDVRMDVLEATDYHTHSPLKGDASYWTIRVGDHVAENAAWSYPNPPSDGPRIKGYIAFYWDMKRMSKSLPTHAIPTSEWISYRVPVPSVSSWEG